MGFQSIDEILVTKYEQVFRIPIQHHLAPHSLISIPPHPPFPLFIPHPFPPLSKSTHLLLIQLLHPPPPLLPAPLHGRHLPFPLSPTGGDLRPLTNKILHGSFLFRLIAIVVAAADDLRGIAPYHHPHIVSGRFFGETNLMKPAEGRERGGEGQ